MHNSLVRPLVEAEDFEVLQHVPQTIIIILIPQECMTK